MERTPERKESRKSVRKILRWAVCGAMMVAAATGCSTGNDEKPDGLSASQICDGTLTTSAAAALERIGNTDQFTELTGTNDIGDPNAFSLELAAKRLHASSSNRNNCHIYKADDKSGHPLLDIGFEPRTNPPNAASPENGDAGERTLYPLGVHAYTHENSGAYLYFACPTTAGKQRASYVKASMFTSVDQLNPQSTGKDRMTILNDVSRSLAKELGCAAQAKLPAKVPAATSGGA